MPVPQDVSIRLMTAADIPAGLRLCRAARWNQTTADWKFVLSVAPAGALVAEDEGGVVGTVATVPYGPFTWVCMVLVDPATRGRGVGRLLLERGLALVPSGVTARLDATPAGEPLYRSLGFEPQYRLARWFVGPRRDRGRPASGVRRLEQTDWTPILQMDANLFGASRRSLLERLAADAPEYAFVLSTDGRLRGYLFGRHGHVREHLGPLAAESRETAEGLLAACLSDHPVRSFFVDAPEREDGWSEVLTDLGLALERSFLRMHCGQLAAAGNPDGIYAVTGPEFG
jgi:GNAT superfamily N-acetyltransferase